VYLAKCKLRINQNSQDNNLYKKEEIETHLSKAYSKLKILPKSHHLRTMIKICRAKLVSSGKMREQVLKNILRVRYSLLERDYKYYCKELRFIWIKFWKVKKVEGNLNTWKKLEGNERKYIPDRRRKIPDSHILRKRYGTRRILNSSHYLNIKKFSSNDSKPLQIQIVLLESIDILSTHLKEIEIIHANLRDESIKLHRKSSLLGSSCLQLIKSLISVCASQKETLEGVHEVLRIKIRHWSEILKANKRYQDAEILCKDYLQYYCPEEGKTPEKNGEKEKKMSNEEGNAIVAEKEIFVFLAKLYEDRAKLYEDGADESNNPTASVQDLKKAQQKIKDAIDIYKKLYYAFSLTRGAEHHEATKNKDEHERLKNRFNELKKSLNKDSINSK